ncbi:hypothetical protein FDB53_05820 [Clostridium botulinum]|nr:hypothetical protein [Clostridium botulinum]
MVKSTRGIIEEDSYYKELKELKSKMDSQLLGNVKERFYRGCSATRKLGYIKDYYKENDTMEAYIDRIGEKYGGIDKMNKSLDRLSSKIGKEFVDNGLSKVVKSQVKQCLCIVMFFETYVVCKNEELVKMILNESGYLKIQTMSRYNSEYGTDFVIKLKHEDYEGIGIRIKFKSYLYVSSDKKKIEFEKQKKLGGMYGVYYIFNDGMGYHPYALEGKMLFNNDIVNDEKNQFYNTFLEVSKGMITSDYNYLIDKILQFFYNKDNLGILSFDEWKAYMKDYESEYDLCSRMCIEAELENMNMFMK